MAGWYGLLVRNRFKPRLGISYLFGLGLLLPCQYWTGIYVGNLPWLILCFGQAFLFLTPSFFVGRGKKYNQQSFIATYVITELLLRTVPFSGFGWTRFGFTQVDSPLKNLYPVGGVVLVGILIAWLSSVRRSRGVILPLLIVLSSLFVPGTVVHGNSAKIALIQGGVVQLGLNFNSKPKEVFYRHLDLTQASVAKDQVSLVIWPENSVDVDLGLNSELNSSIELLSKSISTSILVGAVTKSMAGPKNESILFAPTKGQVYTKRYLTPFGEYLPFRKVSEQLSDYAGDITDFIPGEQPILFRTSNMKFNTLICYEILNDSFVDESINDFLVIQTNNATFGDSDQLDQQLNIARVRAAESGRYIAYVSTTGTTSFIGPDGQILSQLPKFKSGTLTDQIQLAKGTTYTQRYGKYFEPIAMLSLGMIIFMRKRGEL